MCRLSQEPVETEALAQGWARAVDILQDRGEVTGAQLGFIRLTKPLGVIDDTILLAVPSEFAKEFIETRARESITAALSDALIRDVKVAVTVDPSLDAAAPPPEPAPPPVRVEPRPEPRHERRQDARIDGVGVDPNA